MALYAAIGAEFKKAILSELDSLVDVRIQRVITQTLKQVAYDYSLNYKELKTRYCTVTPPAPPPSPVAPPVQPPVQPPAQPPVQPPVAPPTPPQVPPVPQVPSAAAGPPVAPESQLPMSKMKKRDLEMECERRGLCPDGTISELKERVKHARLLEKPAKKARKPKDPNAPKKERKKKEVSPSPPAASSASAAPAAPAAPVKASRPLEIEDDEEDNLDDADEFEKEFDEEDDQGETMQSRIRRLLAAHGEELNEDDDFADA